MADGSTVLQLRDLATSEDIDRLIDAGAAVICGCSGGKDSVGAALAAYAYLDRRGHKGPRALVHSDLGSIEWKDSLPICRELAQYLNTELIVLSRKAGGMIERWESRWESSVRRYSDLSTVTLVPWPSTPSMRFCTSELKVQVINPELLRRYKGGVIINVTGIRRDESARRAKTVVAQLDNAWSRKDTQFWNWRPIVDWTAEDDFAAIRAAGLRIHPAYTEWNMSRVSCSACIMSNIADLQNSARNPEHHEAFLRLVSLEIRSTFAFQGARWLGDVSDAFMSPDQREALVLAKARAARRKAAEARIPAELLYTKGWPERTVTRAEAELLAGVRAEVADAVGLKIEVATADQVMARYDELMSARPAVAQTPTPVADVQLTLL